jgi:hypothetical protein
MPPPVADSAIESGRKIATILTMLAACPSHQVFEQFLLTSEAQTAPRWQLEILAAWPWPECVEPTVESFTRMRAALDTLQDPSADRVAG